MIHRIKLRTSCGMTKIVDNDFNKDPCDANNQYLLPIQYQRKMSAGGSLHPINYVGTREFNSTGEVELLGDVLIHIYQEGDTY